MDAPTVMPNLLVVSDRARASIDDILSRGERPVVVGRAVLDALVAFLPGAHALTNTAELEVQAVVSDTDLRELLSQRYFTVDALAWDPVGGEVIDPFGGWADVQAGVLRHLPHSCGEHPLGVIRGVNFAGRFGMHFASETRALCRELSDRRDEIPRDQMWAEWRSLAREAEHWPEALDALRESGWLRHFPDLAASRGIPQDPRWHAEGDVWTHTGLAARSAAVTAAQTGLSGEDREVAVLGALTHDFGKVTHTTINGSAITSRGHAEAGVAPARRFLEAIGAPSTLIEKILPLVREHMAHVSVDGRPSAAAVRRLIRRLAGTGGGPTIYDWARVVDADCAGRGRTAKPSPSPQWLAIARSSHSDAWSEATEQHAIIDNESH